MRIWKYNPSISVGCCVVLLGIAYSFYYRCTEDVKEIPAVLKMMVTLEPFSKNGAELGLCLIVSWLLEESLWQAAVLTKAKFGLGYT